MIRTASLRPPRRLASYRWLVAGAKCTCCPMPIDRCSHDARRPVMRFRTCHVHCLFALSCTSQTYMYTSRFSAATLVGKGIGAGRRPAMRNLPPDLRGRCRRRREKSPRPAGCPAQSEGTSPKAMQNFPPPGETPASAIEESTGKQRRLS